ncbi:BZ3500_MvSof-1268-A1-R1_Chr10-1g02662 [Microbotryum saponariae]|uniref:BZ3500_MvSof-1268-A1-R1_Chr10-1g02662 protein n=1 Tax=Microbotryum saponariae TaxID=289078 RepID=A0A2X0L4C7_9BASI|nr:BZ3500_MvSof-1268-A1-R1_Chr10-1g02662 [Microbotryum saponariae]SDA06151.1 BZ3501_MvSof-1269-A2-R1_Chr10-1g02263 [Microbotryum saponariae]
MVNDRPTESQAKHALASLLAAAFPGANSTGTSTGLGTTDLNAASPIGFDARVVASNAPATTASTSSAVTQASSEELLRALTHGTISSGSSRANHLVGTSTSNLIPPSSSPRTTALSHTLEFLAAQPNLFAGLAVAPPSPSAHVSRNNPPVSYTPLPTRSGRVPHAPNAATTTETDRETMLFNDYFDWPSSDEDDPDFQPGRTNPAWDDGLFDLGTAGPSSGGTRYIFSPDEEGDEEGESDYSAVDETFTPGKGLVDVDFGPLVPKSVSPTAVGTPHSRELRSRTLQSSSGPNARSIDELAVGSSTHRGPPLPSSAFEVTLAPALAPTRSKRPTTTPRIDKFTSSSPARTSPRKKARTNLSPMTEEDDRATPIASTSQLPSTRPNKANVVYKYVDTTTTTYSDLPPGMARLKKSAGLGPAPQPKPKKRKVVAHPPPQPLPPPPPPLPEGSSHQGRIQGHVADLDREIPTNKLENTPLHSNVSSTPSQASPDRRSGSMTAEEKLEARRQKNREAAKESRLKANRERVEKEERLVFLEREYVRLTRRVKELEEEGRGGRSDRSVGGDEDGDGDDDGDGESVIDSLEDSEEENEEEEAWGGEEEERAKTAQERGTRAAGGSGAGAGDDRRTSRAGFDLGQLTQHQLSELSRLLASATRN